jgi:DUF4097 and DUF4098 domain-containing protein YvlB
MSRTRLSSVDILGITLGVIVILMVIGSVVVIGRERMWNAGWSFSDGRGWFENGGFTFGGNAEREEKDEIVPTGITEVEVHTIAGSIDVSGSASATEVAVHSVKTGPTTAALATVHVDIQKRGSRLILEEKHDQGFFPRSGTISFQIVIPAGVKVVEAHSISGNVTMRDVSAGIDETLSTISGNVNTSAARNLDASSTSGGIEFAMTGTSLSARSVSGPITGTMASLGNGGSAKISTISGSVNLSASGTVDTKVSLHSVSGQVSCDFPVTISQQKRNRLEGTIGSGAGTLDVGTVSGSISINKD